MNNHLQADDRLAILRSEDQFRSWDSLDEKRFCILCERIFSGRQVQIKRARHGKYQLHCPTEHCNSVPWQWVHPHSPIIPEEAYGDWWRAPREKRKLPSARAGSASLKLRRA